MIPGLRSLLNGLSQSLIPPSVLMACLGLPEAWAGERTARITLMALGDNRVADLDALSHCYDLMIASANVGQDVIAAFRQRNPGALVFCCVNTSDINADSASARTTRSSGTTRRRPCCRGRQRRRRPPVAGGRPLP